MKALEPLCEQCQRDACGCVYLPRRASTTRHASKSPPSMLACVVTKLCVHLTSPQCVFGGIEASAFMAADEFRVAVVSSQLMH